MFYEPDPEEDEWTRVSYRRGRMQQPRRKPRPLLPETSGADTDPRRNRRPRNRSRSYAAVTRGTQRHSSGYPSRSFDRQFGEDDWQNTAANGAQRPRDYEPRRNRRPRNRSRSYAAVTRGTQRHYSGYPTRSFDRQFGEDYWQNTAANAARRPRDHENFTWSRGARTVRPNEQRGRPTGTGEMNQRRHRQPGEGQNDDSNEVQHRVVSDDPDFSLKVRIIHKIIKSIHHLTNVCGESAPPIIARTTASLASFIKPAAPNSATQLLLEGNAKNWEHTAMIILKQHYEDSMESEIQDLANFPNREWGGPFEVAVTWAARNLGRRLKTGTINKAQAFLSSNLTSGQPAEHGVNPGQTVPPQARADVTGVQVRTDGAPPTPAPTAPPTQPAAPATRAEESTAVSLPAATHTPAVATPPLQPAALGTGAESSRAVLPPTAQGEEDRDVPSPPLHPPSHFSVSPAFLTPPSQPSPPPLSFSLSSSPSPPPSLSPSIPCLSPPSLPSPLLPPPLPLPLFSFSPSPPSLSLPPSLPPPPAPALLSAPPFSSRFPPLQAMQPRPKRERQQRGSGDGPGPGPVTTKRGPVPGLTPTAPGPIGAAAPLPPPPRSSCGALEDAIVQELRQERTKTPDPRPEPPTWVPSLTPVGIRKRPGTTPPTPQPQTGCDTATHLKTSAPSPSDSARPEELQQRTTPEATPTLTPTRRPTRHLNTLRKLKDWSLCVRKKFLIIGDSNVARFPPFQNQDLQVDSYPGATFRHAEALLLKAVSQTEVETIILSFGINSRGQKTRATTVRQLQGAVRAAKNRFPGATVLVPVINFTMSLPQREKLNLHILNSYIAKNCNYISHLPSREFGTEPDRIHWTHQTAARMLDHWLSQVNRRSP